jgi:hypothetical protein
MTITAEPELGVPLEKAKPSLDLKERTNAAANTAKELGKHGLDVTPDKEDKDVASKISASYAGDPAGSGDKVSYVVVAGGGGSSPWTVSGNDIYYNTGAVSVGTTTPNASAAVQVDSTTQGFLPPRMTTAQRTAISSPAEGLMVFDTDLKQWMGYDSTQWVVIG